MTRIFLIRHAEAEGNIHRRAHGQFDGQITTRGFDQIELLKERFQNEKIDAVYSSDLTRARITAEALSQPRGLGIATAAELREICMGEWEDVAWGNLEYLYPEMSANFNRDPANWKVNGGEAYADVIDRMTGYIKETASCHDGDTIAFFSHGFAIRAFFCNQMGYRSDEVRKMKYCDNTAVALMSYDNGSFTIEYHSDNSHLSQETSTFARQIWWRAAMPAINENLRYMTLDEKRDSELIESYRQEYMEKTAASEEYIALRADEPIGFIGLDADKDREESAGWVASLYMKPEYRGKGFSVQLLGCAISEFRRQRREKLRAEAPGGNEIINLCLNNGFKIVSGSGGQTLLEKNIRIW